MRQLVEFLARSLVDDAGAVQVRAAPAAEGQGVLIDLAVAPADVGKVIGRGGRVARALRSVVRAAALRHRVRVVLNITSNA
ncbi:MAG TPA: KH domain-containing protein [bacterium]|nr:KH domain-containing protein [bacterium]